jgi:hypothetical protein
MSLVKQPGRRVPAGDGVMSVAEVATACRVGVTTVKNWANGRLLDSFTLPSGVRRFRVADVRRFMADRALDTDILDGMVGAAVGSGAVYVYGGPPPAGWKGPTSEFADPLDLAAAVVRRLPLAVVVGPTVTAEDAGNLARWVRRQPGGTLVCLVLALGEYAVRRGEVCDLFDHVLDHPHPPQSVACAIIAGCRPPLNSRPAGRRR